MGVELYFVLVVECKLVYLGIEGKVIGVVGGVIDW